MNSLAALMLLMCNTAAVSAQLFCEAALNDMNHDHAAVEAPGEAPSIATMESERHPDGLWWE